MEVVQVPAPRGVQRTQVEEREQEGDEEERLRGCREPRRDREVALADADALERVLRMDLCAAAATAPVPKSATGGAFATPYS